jgi:excisionase family DNA binding protein
MALHVGQLCLFEVEIEPHDDLTDEVRSESPNAASRRDKPPRDDTCPTTGENSETLTAWAITTDRAAPLRANDAAGSLVESRRPDTPEQARDSVRRDANGAQRKIVERHYKTREVAELLSVHEETVLRLAQCGSLHSVRIGSERRYPESAIVDFLKRNADDANVLVPRATKARRSLRARMPQTSRSTG